MLTATEFSYFAENGFIILRDIFSASEIDVLRSATETPEITKELEIRKSGDRLAHLLELTTKDPVFKNLALDLRITKRVANLIGDDIQLQHSKLAAKPRKRGAGEFAWHQDFARFPHTNRDLVAVNVMLDDATPENGGMYALRGSHKLGLRNHIRNGWMVGPCYENDLWEMAPAESVVQLMAPAGGLIIHHCLLLHFSPATQSGASRRMIALQYRAGDAIQLANNVWTDTGFQVHGKPSGRVRCEDIEIDLPRDPLWLRYCGEPHGDVFNQIGAAARSWNEEALERQQTAVTGTAT